MKSQYAEKASQLEFSQWRPNCELKTELLLADKQRIAS